MFKEYFYRTFTPSPLSEQTGLYPNWTGSLKASENYQCRARVLDDYFIILVKKGAGRFISAGKSFKLAPGSIFFLFPGIIHSYYTSSKNLLELSWIGFNGFMAGNILMNLNIHPGSPIISIRETGTHTFSALLDEIISSPPQSEPLGLSGRLYSLFSLLLEPEENSWNSRTEVQARQNNKIQRALSYLDQNYRTDISISTLAEYASMSRSAFSRLFRQETGRSPQSYLIDIRLLQAEHMLTGKMKIRDIAHAAGFNDEYYFSRSFKQKYGISPNGFRKARKLELESKSRPGADKTWL